MFSTSSFMGKRWLWLGNLCVYLRCVKLSTIYLCLFLIMVKFVCFCFISVPPSNCPSGFYYGSTCCDSNCIGGCTGPSPQQCLACKQVMQYTGNGFPTCTQRCTAGTYMVIIIWLIDTYFVIVIVSIRHL